MNLHPACDAERQAEHTETSRRKKRVWTIDELRMRLGVAAPASEAEGEKRTKRSEPETRQKPRIVKRGMAPAMA